LASPPRDRSAGGGLVWAPCPAGWPQRTPSAATPDLLGPNQMPEVRVVALRGRGRAVACTKGGRVGFAGRGLVSAGWCPTRWKARLQELVVGGFPSLTTTTRRCQTDDGQAGDPFVGRCPDNGRGLASWWTRTCLWARGSSVDGVRPCWRGRCLQYRCCGILRRQI